MDNFKGETRQALLNRAFLYIVLIGFSFFIFLRVRALLFDLFVAVVLSVLAEPIVYRLSKSLIEDSQRLLLLEQLFW